jgi:hypothetical protein
MREYLKFTGLAVVFYLGIVEFLDCLVNFITAI